MDIHKRNDLLLISSLALLNVGSLLKYGYKRIVLISIIIIIAKLFEIVVRGITKSNRNFSPIWILLISPLILPPLLPTYMVVSSVIFGLLIGVVFFGGEGREIISPIALIWGFAALSFPVIYNQSWVFPFPGISLDISRDLATMPLFENHIEFVKTSNIDIYNFLTGNIPGTPGSAIPILIIIIGIIFAIFKIIDLKLCLTFIISTILISTFIVYGSFVDSLKYLLSGNFLLVAFIILPLKKHGPKTTGGSYIIGILGAILLLTINRFSSYFDGSLFTVLILNIFIPIIDDAVLKFKVIKRGKYA
ncbi:MAG: RnfABCDGE type electron transport complex subunit D [Spirochaetaceae bacterium]